MGNLECSERTTAMRGLIPFPPFSGQLNSCQLSTGFAVCFGLCKQSLLDPWIPAGCEMLDNFVWECSSRGARCFRGWR